MSTKPCSQWCPVNRANIKFGASQSSKVKGPTSLQALVVSYTSHYKDAAQHTAQKQGSEFSYIQTQSLSEKKGSKVWLILSSGKYPLGMLNCTVIQHIPKQQ